MDEIEEIALIEFEDVKLIGKIHVIDMSGADDSDDKELLKMMIAD